MEDLNADELKQLVNFYKQRASELELSLLTLQIKSNRQPVKQEVSVPAIKTTKSKS